VIVGHSLGGVKVVYYQGNRQRTDVLGVVSYSAPIIAFPDRLERAPDSLKTLQEAEALVEAGRGEEYITEEDTGAVRRFTARTFLSKYGRHGKTDVRPLAAHIGGPLLATAGGLEVDTFATHARQLAEAAGPDRGNWHVVEGADHFYAGHLPELVELTVPWLNRVTKAPVASS
jgi:pimeloyl-ACP methyl ester carboxylesterase